MKRKCIYESDSEQNLESFDICCLSDLVKLSFDYKTRYIGNPDIEKLWNIRHSIKKLDELIGMSALKNNIMHQIMFICQNLNNDEMMHTALMGPPGVGKTTVAKIIGEIYTKLGNLSKGTFKIAGREDMVAEYLGQTAVKTKKLLTSCLGGVLFIDEAYSLGSSGGNDKDSYSKECIDTLTKFLSENPKDFVCIIAGYTDEIKKYIFSSNPGLNRRFPWKYIMKNYDTMELKEIFKFKLNDKWKLRNQESHKMLDVIIADNKESFVNNGGDIDNFISSCKIMHSKRMFGKDTIWKKYITKEDLQDGIILFKNHKSNENSDSTIIPHMYL